MCADVMALRHWTFAGADLPLPKTVINEGNEARSLLDPQVYDTLFSTGRIGCAYKATTCL